MKHFFFSFCTLTISIIGFIVIPIFIFGVDVTNYRTGDVLPEAVEARKKLDNMRENGASESAEDVEKWWSIINSQPKKIHTDAELYAIAQNNFLWFSWAPVFLSFFFFSKNKKKDLIYFIGAALFTYVIGTLILNTLFTYIVAGLLGGLLSSRRNRKVERNKGQSKLNQ